MPQPLPATGAATSRDVLAATSTELCGTLVAERLFTILADANLASVLNLLEATLCFRSTACEETPDALSSGIHIASDLSRSDAPGEQHKT